MSNIYHLVKYEIKLLLTSYEKILAGILFLAFFSVMLLAAVQWAVSSGRLFEKFTIGVVDEDGSAEIKLLLQSFNSTESISNIIVLERMDYKMASSKLMADELPAFLIVPEGFTESVKTGENISLTLVGNENRHLQLMATRLLMDAGITFLTSSQAGIYSTLAYAHEKGITQEEINNQIVMPINLAYFRELLNHHNYFRTILLQPTGSIDLQEYYTNSILSFLLTVWMLVFSGVLSLSFDRKLLMKYKFYGIGINKVFAIKLLAFYVILLILLLPLCYLYGVKLAILVFHFGNLGIMATVLFRSELSTGLFLFTLGLFSIFAAGGILPLSYLPDIFESIGKLTYSYWLIRIQEPISAFVLLLFGIFYLCISAIVISRRVSM